MSSYRPLSDGWSDLIANAPLPKVPMHFRGSYLAGKAWRSAAGGNLLLWIYWLFLPFGAYTFLTCDSERAFAHAPAALLASYAPFVAVSVALELHANRYMMPTYAVELGAYKMFEKPVVFQVYFGMKLMLCIAAHLDLATTGIFTVRLVKTTHCPTSQVQNIWDTTVAKSIFHMLPGLDMVAVTLWLLMALQFVIAVWFGVPTTFIQLKAYLTRSEPGVKEDDFEDDSDNVYPLDSVMEMSTCSDPCTNCFRALCAHAEAGRMLLLTDRAFDFQMKIDVDKLLFQSEQNWYEEQVERSRRAFCSDCRKLVWRTAATLLFESAVQPNLQASALAVNIAAHQGHGGFDPETMLSISLGVVMAVFNLVTSRTKVLHMNQIMQDILHDPKELQMNEMAEELSLSMNRNVMAFNAVAVFVLASIAHTTANTTAKLLAAFFFCSDGVWNVTGCVHPHIQNFTNFTV